MSVTERLANLSIPSVLAIVAVLVALRFLMLRQRTPFARSVAEIAESLAIAMALVFLLIRPFIVQTFFIPSESMVPTLLVRDHILVNKLVFRFAEPKRGDVVVFKSPPEANSDGTEKDFIKRVIAVAGDRVRITPGYVQAGNYRFGHGELSVALAKSGERGPIKLVDGAVMLNGQRFTAAQIAAQVGRPPHKVSIVPGRVIVNGKPLDEPYVAEDPDQPYPSNSTPPDWVEIEDDGEPVVRIPSGKLLVMGDNRNDSNDSRVWGLLDRDRVVGKAMVRFWPLGRLGLVR